MDVFKSVRNTIELGRSTVHGFKEAIESMKISQGLMLTEQNRRRTSTALRDYEFKVFSQWGEDGIIQRLVEIVPIKNQTFIEFGVEDFSESNCRFLMMKDNWSGFVIDGSPDNIAKVTGSYFYWRHDLHAKCAFITRDNINEVLAASGFDHDLGVLSIDIDGNDYYVLETIDLYRPRILVCEYNAVFGVERKISVPYDDRFFRTTAHYSNLYFGASLGAIAHAAEKKGYSLVGTNSAGNDSFFVRNDLLSERLPAMSVTDAFHSSKFRESRDRQGRLTHLAGDDRLSLIKGMPVYNVETGQIEQL